eukprot:64298-Alexandrium_andersonii.AAC.1
MFSTMPPAAHGRTAGQPSRQTHFGNAFPRTGARHLAQQLRRRPLGANAFQGCVGGPAWHVRR